MLSSTKDDYKINYKDRLSNYLNDYGDNTPSSFLEIELENYTDYCSSLIKISDYFKNKTTKDLRVNSDINRVILDLKNINESVFNEIFTIEKTTVVTDKVELDNGFVDDMILGYIQGRIEIDFKKLTNSITSAKSILKEINDKKSNLKNSDVPEKKIVKSETEKNNASDKKEDSKDIVANDYTKSAIEDHLFNIKDDIKSDQYKILVDALYHYFTTGNFPKLKKKIMFKSVNKKKVGWALKMAYMDIKTDKLSEEYLQFAKDNINLFEKVKSNSKNFTDSNLYRYFTTNPDK